MGNVRRSVNRGIATPNRKNVSHPVAKPSKRGVGAVPIIIAVVLLVAVIGGVVAMSMISPSRSECKKVIAKFEEASNELNVSVIADCLEPSVATNAIKIGSTLVTDDVIDSIFELLGSEMSSLGLGDNVDAKEIFQTIKIEPKQFGFPTKTRMIKCKASVLGISKYMNIYVTKYMGDIYITKAEFIKNK